MRGRLILPLVAEVAQLDTFETAQDPDDDGPIESGYDPDFREPVKLPSSTGEGPGTTNRKETSPMRFAAQVEMGTAEKLQQFFSGADLDERLALVTHLGELEERGLVDEDGTGPFRIGDRLVKLLDRNEAVVLYTPREPLYVTEIQPAGLGLGGSRNLFVIFFESRDDGTAG